MSKNFDNIIDELAKHATKLKDDLDSKKPRVFAPVVWSYQDSRVRDAVAKRLAAGEILTSSSPIVPDRALRRERVYFDFSPQGRLDAKIPGILVQINDDNSVAEILNPFDLQSDSELTASTSTDTLPLFVVQSSGPVIFDSGTERELRNRWIRFAGQPELARTFMSGESSLFGGTFGGVFGFRADDTVSGGTLYPGSTSVMSSQGSKEDPDDDWKGARFDDSRGGMT